MSLFCTHYISAKKANFLHAQSLCEVDLLLVDPNQQVQ
jgi:hypothetical protein